MSTIVCICIRNVVIVLQCIYCFNYYSICRHIILEYLNLDINAEIQCCQHAWDLHDPPMTTLSIYPMYKEVYDTCIQDIM